MELSINKIGIWCKVALAISILLSGVTVNAQEQVYKSMDGNMVINAMLNDSTFSLHTKKLLVLLNYETAEFTIKIDKSTFYTNVDSINRKLSMLKYDIIEYNGKLGLDYINTKDHLPLDFEVEGVLSTNGKLIRGTGRLTHIHDGIKYACLLEMSFHVKIEDTGLDINFPGLADEVQIKIIQTVLRKSNE